MSKLQNLNNQIEKAQEEIRQKENRIKELVAKQKAEEKKARNHRLCKRHGLLESLLPEIIEITDEQYKAFIERAVANNYGRDILAKIIVQSDKNDTSKAPSGAENSTSPSNATQAKTADHNTTPTNSKPPSATPQSNATPTAKPATANHNSNNAHNSNAGGGTTDRGN